MKKYLGVAEIDELQTFVSKKNKQWLWTVVNHWQPGILSWALGDRSTWGMATIIEFYSHIPLKPMPR